MPQEKPNPNSHQPPESAPTLQKLQVGSAVTGALAGGALHTAAEALVFRQFTDGANFELILAFGALTLASFYLSGLSQNMGRHLDDQPSARTGLPQMLFDRSRGGIYDEIYKRTVLLGATGISTLASGYKTIESPELLNFGLLGVSAILFGLSAYAVLGSLNHEKNR